jgi:hypothetical protein
MLDEVITHEIGHNWFYGVLGFNERAHPWLDEGINSYYDHRYTRSYYGKNRFDDLPRLFRSLATAEWTAIYHGMAHRKALAQPSDLHSTDYHFNNYFLATYENPALAFRYLSEYLGEAKFDQIMQTFYRKWAFTHPGPEDLRVHFEQHTGRNLDWFFEGMIGDTRVFDYGIRSITREENGYRLALRNHTAYPVPVHLSGFHNDSLVYSHWVEGFTGDSLLEISLDPASHFVLDHQQLFTELNRADNTRSTSFNLFHRKPGFRFFDVVEDPGRNQAGWLPSFGWNKSDGFLFGLMVFNHTLPQKNFQFTFHPLISTGTGDNRDWLTGMGKISYDWYRNQTLRNIRVSAAVKSFHYDLPNGTPLRYIANRGEVRLRFNRDLTDNRYLDLSFNLHTVINEKYIFAINDFVDETLNAVTVGIKQYDQSSLLPAKWELRTEFANYEDYYLASTQNYLKLTGSFSTHFLYAQKKKIDLRIYGGGFLWHNKPKSTLNRPGTLGLIGYAVNDYLYEDYFFDRGTQDGPWSRQINTAGGGFKTAVSTAYGLGQSNQYVVSMNLKADLPFDVPVLSTLKPFLDIGMYGYLPTISEGYQNRFLYSGGLMLETYEGALNVYLPLINSKEIENIFREDDQYLRRLSFSLNLNLFDFTKLLDRDDLLFSQ